MTSLAFNNCALKYQKMYLQLCTKQRFRSACVFSVWSKSSLGAFWIAKDEKFSHADNEDWSDWADAQADLSLSWRMPEGIFSQVPAQILTSPIKCLHMPWDPFLHELNT